MSDFSWRHGITAGLTLIIAFAFGGYILGHQLGEQVGQADAKTQEYARHAAEEIESTCFGLEATAKAECIVRVIEATNEDERAEHDLNAQRNMAKWALLMLLATVAMAVITAFGVYYVWRTLNATQSMARDTRRVGNTQLRPYIFANQAKPERADGDNVVIHLHIKNSGYTPANSVRVTWRTGLNYSNDKPMVQTASGFGAVGAIFPSQSRSVSTSLNIGVVAREMWGDRVTAILTGRIDYFDPVNNIEQHTKFQFNADNLTSGAHLWDFLPIMVSCDGKDHT